jgi:hypothetical protein
MVLRLRRIGTLRSNRSRAVGMHLRPPIHRWHMRFTPERCMVCSTPVRGTIYPVKYPTIAREDGRAFHGELSRFWFCSADCIEMALDQYLEPRFQSRKKVHDDPEMKQLMQQAENSEEEVVKGSYWWEKLVEVATKWKEDKRYALIMAKSNLNSRISKEDLMQYEKQKADINFISKCLGNVGE